MGAQWYDGNISIPGCDKNMPGCLIAMGRFNRPSMIVYGGTIRAGDVMSLGAKSTFTLTLTMTQGCAPGSTEPLDIVSAFQAYGEYLASDQSEAARLKLILLTLTPTLNPRKPRRNASPPSAMPALVPVPVAACTRRTRWVPSLKPWG